MIPSNAPTGHIFVQKSLFLKNTRIITAIVTHIPNIERLEAEPKIVYGSTCLKIKAEPPKSNPKLIPAIKYLYFALGTGSFFFLLKMSANTSCNIPNGHISEQ